MRCDVISSAHEQDAAVFELLIRQLCVIAKQQHRDVIAERVADAQTRRAELALERLGAADIVQRIVIGLSEIVDRRVCRGQEILRRGLNAHSRELFDVGVCSA